MLRVSGKIVSNFWRKTPLMSSNFGHSKIVCVIVSEPCPQQGHVALRVIDIRVAEDRSGWQRYLASFYTGYLKP